MAVEAGRRDHIAIYHTTPRTYTCDPSQVLIHSDSQTTIPKALYGFPSAHRQYCPEHVSVPEIFQNREPQLSLSARVRAIVFDDSDPIPAPQRNSDPS